MMKRKGSLSVKKKYIVFALGLVFIHFLFLVKLKFTAWPEMVAWPYLILHGWLPYRDIAIAHTPLLLVDLTIFNKIFGVGLVQLKIYTWIWIFLTDAILFYIAKRLWGLKTALLSLAFYIPLQIIYEGNGLWFDLALAPLALLIYYSLKNKQFLWAGVWFGVAVFIKQTAFWLAFPVALFFLPDIKKKTVKDFFLFFEGALVICAVVALSLFFLGILPDFYNWAVKFGVLYLPHAQGQVLLPDLKQILISLFPFAIFIPFILPKGRKHLDLVIWAFFSALGVYPRFELFHFQPALLFLAIAGGIFALKTLKGKKWFYRIVLFTYGTLLVCISGKFVARNWGVEARFYGRQEENVSFYVKSLTSPEEKIYVLNYWDSIYAMTQTLPAIRPLIPYLSWYIEYDDIKETMAADLKLDMPQVIVGRSYTGSGLGSYRVSQIDKLLARYYSLSYKNGDVEIYRLNK